MVTDNRSKVKLLNIPFEHGGIYAAITERVALAFQKGGPQKKSADRIRRKMSNSL